MESSQAPFAKAGWRSAIVSLIAPALLAACAVPTPQPISPEAAAADLNVQIEQAQAARQAGDVPKALSVLHDAAKAHPTKKQPWIKQAQIQFDAGNYSAAVVAAEEALQRDANDSTALSVISVSGLRLAANSLQQLRKTSAVSGSTRVEAEALARTIREAIGEEVLVPVAAPTNTNQPTTTGSRRRSTNLNRMAAPASGANGSGVAAGAAVGGGTAGTSSGSGSARAPGTPSSKPAASPSAGGRNPFNVLQ